jgi:hypothetical protein
MLIEKEVISMIARLMDSLYSWLKKAAEEVLACLKKYGPEDWDEALDSLKENQIGPMLQAGYDLLKSSPNAWILVLVVYLLATSGLLKVLVMAILGLGLILVINQLNGNQCQEA